MKHTPNTFKEKCMPKSVQKRCSKAAKWHFLTKKANFLTKNTCKIKNNGPRDLNLGLKWSLESPFDDWRCSQIIFCQKIGSDGPQILIMGENWRVKVQVQWLFFPYFLISLSLLILKDAEKYIRKFSGPRFTPFFWVYSHDFFTHVTPWNIPTK